ncbi:MAG: hypothetical protein EON91_08945 [Brevundimonas sp.]|uniref:hypothetical protein n=1 Tax=Brevundimonas sp. TaxID=1871086 RepID=UPI001206B38F|nr:hypothetical protein [Brevundimonas sp.]RZJ17542.1 MAG: hypothetical protein EON91_08945 [Brevundimonas sp.]
MRMLQTLLLLIGAMAVLVLGAGGMPASAAEPAPCHAEGATHHSAPDTPATPSKALKTMGCCVVCVTAPLPQPPGATTAAASAARPARLPTALPRGLIPSPEPFPPRA